MTTHILLKVYPVHCAQTLILHVRAGPARVCFLVSTFYPLFTLVPELFRCLAMLQSKRNVLDRPHIYTSD